ncbi:MAG: hypothetical protein CMO80_11480 [Verrucomicrobiales bacterium]|nr:hypothetical protein [Verrucomicrobiales bacterium]|tara:strand:+ start:696 stop:1472 length:777 start_codon:yes stop_codon:yes gene_type:complete
MESEEQKSVEAISLADLLSEERLREICESEMDLYWTDDWSPEFYVSLARHGFISVAVEMMPGLDLLLPQMQPDYAVLDWPDLRVSRSMRRWMRKPECVDAGYELVVGFETSAVHAGIAKHHAGDNWMSSRYLELLEELSRWDSNRGDDFELMPIGLVNGAGELAAGEMGYRYGRVYTSLTGFCDRERTNTGTLQLFKLGEYLRDAGFAFWNLGQPFMQYKFDLGAVSVPRGQFLEKWNTHVSEPFDARPIHAVHPRND